MNARPAAGRLAENVLHFARVLRASGIPIGTDKVMDAVRMLPRSGLERRDDWRSTLAALFLTRHEQQALFDEAFERFWREPRVGDPNLERLPKVHGRARPPAAGGRLAQALHPAGAAAARDAGAPPEVQLDATLTVSAEERLRTLDFERMSAAEWADARHLIERLRLPVPLVRTRRYAAASHGAAIDGAATLRRMARAGGEIATLARRAHVRRPPPLVVLCDISGSMHRYTRMFLHFLHALTRDRERVATFLFGTRLTHVTRPLRDRDVDEALARVAAAVPDWAGGTRIGACLNEFNRRWARRVLGQNACVLLVTDGLECGEADALASEIADLHRACHRLVWLNPLLRYAGFEPTAAGIGAMRPHVDAFLPMHNIETLRDLAAALGGRSWN